MDAGSAELLAILADGSFRDALGGLQKILNFSKGKKIKREDVEKITGAGFRLGAALKQPVTIGAITLPLWAWLLIAAGAMGFAGYFFLFKKK